MHFGPIWIHPLLFYPSIHPFKPHFPIEYPSMKSSWNIFLKLCASIHPIIPCPLFPTILIFHLVLSSPPNHCTPFHCKQDKHYLKWNRMNIKWLGHDDWTTVFFLPLSSVCGSQWSSSSMIKRSMSSISLADESCFLTLIRALRGLAMAAEEHLHGRSGSGIADKNLIVVIMQEYF